jgi:hypothetical protein
VVTKSDRSAQAVRDVVRDHYENTAFHVAAEQTALRVRPQFAVDQVALIRERIGPLLL